VATTTRRTTLELIRAQSTRSPRTAALVAWRGQFVKIQSKVKLSKPEFQESKQERSSPQETYASREWMR
jgi:hypothetical protein